MADTEGCDYCAFVSTEKEKTSAHFREFIPELIPYLGITEPRVDPQHPVDTIREYVRKNDAPKWAGRLAPPKIDKGKQSAQDAFTSNTTSLPGRDGKGVGRGKRTCLGDRKDKAKKTQDKKSIGNMVRAVVSAAVRGTSDLTPNYDGNQQYSDSEKYLWTTKKSAGHTRKKDDQIGDVEIDDDGDDGDEDDEDGEDDEDDDDDDDDDDDGDDGDDDDDDRFYNSHGSNNTPKHIISDSNIHQVGRAPRISNHDHCGNFNVHVHLYNARPTPQVTKDAPSQPDNSSSAITIPPSDTAPGTFTGFPLFTLLIDILGVVIHVPVEFNTTLEQVYHQMRQHIRNPIRGVAVEGFLYGNGEWNGCWDHRVWDRVKQAANDAVRPPAYRVEFLVHIRMPF